jgi:hypothetical protein
MNDTEFIELLNLYLDHEISPASAARLEAEVQSNPARRHIYQQYCRMQKACRMIAADFQTEPVETAVATERTIIAFNPAVAEAVALRRKRTAVYAVGSFAALAACVALIFVGAGEKPSALQPGNATVVPVAVSAPSSPIVNPDATFVVSQSATPRGLVSLAPRPQPMMVRDPLFLTGRSAAHTAVEGDSNHADNQLAWIHAVKLEPLQVRAPADLHFAATLSNTEGRALGNRAVTPQKTSQPTDEYLGFQFVK